MPSEVNVYSRNLKVISILFIVYWFVGAHPKDNEIVLGTLRVIVDHPERLHYVAYTLLFYFWWRFHIHSKGKISFSYQEFFKSKMTHRKYEHWCKLIEKKAREDFFNSGKVVQFIEDNRLKTTKENISIREPSLSNSNTPTNFSYDYSVNVNDTQPINNFSLIGRNKKFSIGISYKVLIHSQVLFDWLRTSEDVADFLLPWALFFVAVVTIIIG